VGAYIKRTSEIGIIEGEFSLEKEGKCLLGSLYKDTDLQVGDKIYTTGFGDIYPKDLYIGKVTEVLPDALSHSMTGYIEPAVDFNELRRVMIILEFDREFY
jgi:rod shape-determining protein MreC